MNCSTNALPISRAIFWRIQGILLRGIISLVLLLAIWIPHYAHFYIDKSPVEALTVNSAIGTPSNAVLNEIAKMHLAIHVELPPERLVPTAESIVNGVLQLPTLDAPLTLHGYPEDLWAGGPSTQLFLASLRIEQLLLRAYDQSGDARFLQHAVQRILAFSAYERSQHEANDFLWNDHAIAARISVLALLWRAARESASLTPEARQEIISLVQRSGRLLAKPSQFTVRTNHGVMQNLALLQIAAGFPTLQEADAWRQLALERLRLQITFYVSPEGFVLEHSGEYHAFGAQLLSEAVRLCALNDLEPPPWLTHAAHLVSLQLRNLIRPDGSLPLIGNTSDGSRFGIPLVPANGSKPVEDEKPPQHPQIGTTLLPVSGYALWWNQGHSNEILTQTLINWAKHDGHGHKHADEGAFHLWSDGINWITSTGYWPYGADGIKEAYGWQSSNAPHRINEAASEQRTNDFLSYITTPTTRAIDLQRQTSGGSIFRRQIIQLDAATTFALDFVKDSALGSETIWTISPRLSLDSSQNPDLYLASSPNTGLRMWISLDNPLHTVVTHHFGSRTPFAGWVVVDNKPTPSHALRVINPQSNSVGATLFSLKKQDRPNGARIKLVPGATPENWQVIIIDGETTRRIERIANTLYSQQDAQTNEKFTWIASPNISDERNYLKSAYTKAINLYPPWRDFKQFRKKLSFMVIIFALIIEAVWQTLLREKANRRFYYIFTVLLWTTIAIWIFLFYLK